MTDKPPPLPPEAFKDQPPPGLPNAPLTTTEGLEPGDVVQIAVQKHDRATGDTYWWKRFAVITKIRGRRNFDALTLKMRPVADPYVKGSDHHHYLEFATSPYDEPQVVTKLPEPWPQGVAAIHMKLLAQRIITIGDE